MLKEKLKNRARDELFSHINRCGVLQASLEDREVWMNETIEYLGERYPDLEDADLGELRAVGMRFCQPAIARGADDSSASNGHANADADADASTASSAA